VYVTAVSESGGNVTVVPQLDELVLIDVVAGVVAVRDPPAASFNKSGEEGAYCSIEQVPVGVFVPVKLIG
jgi:hypothetical protein